MAGTETGSEILAYCGTCKMDLSAVIVAKVGSKIMKVLCKTCKKERAYKPAKGVKEPGAEGTISTPKKRAAKEKGAASEAPRTVSVEAEWSRLMSETTQAPRVKYTPKAKLQLGDVVQHPTFGDGVVTRLQHPNKAEIIFKTDLKLLIHSR